MRVLPSSHNSPETAFIIPDYPFGFRLRCKKRIWIETAKQGKGKGQQRICSQTTDPRVSINAENKYKDKEEEYWNKPKYSVYSSMCFLVEGVIPNCKETKPGYISLHEVSIHSSIKHVIYTKSEFYNLMDDEQKRRFDGIEKMSRVLNKNSWKEYEETVKSL